VLRQLVDLLQPLHLAVAEEGVAADEKLRKRACKTGNGRWLQCSVVNDGFRN
jgi:hypothetical protein